MIAIKITSVQAIVEKQKGSFIANVVGAIVDLKPRSKGSSSRSSKQR